jgi:hypothetical protein
MTQHFDEHYVNTYNDSNNVLDVEGSGMKNGDRLIFWKWHGSPNQLWYKHKIGENVYRIVNKNSGKCLTAQGRKIVQSAATGE